MFIAIIGTPVSGKSTVQDFLVTFKGFTAIRLVIKTAENGSELESVLEPANDGPSDDIRTAFYYEPPSQEANRSSSSSSESISSPAPSNHDHQVLTFSSPSLLLDFITRSWRSNFVTTDLNTRELVEQFVKRPFFLLISVDAPTFVRFQWSNLKGSRTSLEDFVRQDDRLVYGTLPRLPDSPKTNTASSLNLLRDLVHLHIFNSFNSTSALYAHLETLDLVNVENLRPTWDTYFMTLASLASHRSNCMKRRVGAILVREKRILATGYNGTPRGLMNCNEGGCARCNGTSRSLECVCLHAEENALLEAGRERVGDGAVLYCNTCPCLKCTVKIIQTGIKEVVYNLTYKVDATSAELFKEAGVQLRRHELTPRVVNT